MKNKKRGASSKTWMVDCRTDSAFDFALKVLNEAKKTKYPFELRVNFVKIAYSNSLETIAKAQTDPKQFKLKTAFKLFNYNLSQISKVAINLFNDPANRLLHISDDYRKECLQKVILNPHDYVEINYNRLESEIAHLLKVKSATVDDKAILGCAYRYNFPKIFEEFPLDKEIKDPNRISSRLMPTNDIVVTIPRNIALLLSVPINQNIHYPKGSLSPKIIPFASFITGETSEIPKSTIIHVPYDSFENISSLIGYAVGNPSNIKEICITIYRLSDDSEVIRKLITASKNKIPCKIYIELSARGEIEQDLMYLIELLRQGDRKYLDIKVQYNGIKVHGKMLYIGIKSADERQKLAIGVFSTGNYNEMTARIYKDYHYISCEPDVIDMIRRNFSVLWNSEQPVLSSISNVLSKEIYQEIMKGKDGKIWIQTNHLDNKHIVNLLREAIRRGCDVKLIVRTTKGFHTRELKNCKTIVGKYLEHSRLYIFGDTKDRRIYLSSSDILFRNLYNRFESYVKITDPSVSETLIDNFRNLYKNGQE